MIINVHLGLPKTATTSLQNEVFPTYLGISYQGKYLDQATNQSEWRALRECWNKFSKGDYCKPCLALWLKALADSGDKRILISEEALMEWRSPRDRKASRWVTERKSAVDTPRSPPHPINEFLSTIISQLPEGGELRAILTIRNQTDYLGSLFAHTTENERLDPAFLKHALETKDPSLMFSQIVKGLHETLGRKNLLLLFYEDGLEVNSKKIMKFIGARGQKSSFQEVSRLNARRVEGGVWSASKEPEIVSLTVRKLNKNRFGRVLLRVVKKVAPRVKELIPKQTRIVSISPEQRKSIQSHFKYDNDQLSSMSGRNLSQMGY